MKKIIIIAICAVVVIGAAIAAVPVVKKMSAEKPSSVEDVTTNPISEEISDNDVERDGSGEEEIVSEEITDEKGEAVTDEKGNVLTTIKKIVETTKKEIGNGTTAKTKETTTKPKTTVKDTTTTKRNGTTVEDTGFVNKAIGEDGKALLGYRKAPEGYYYCDDKDCWQKGAGYNEVYDNMAPVACMFIDQIRIRFTYGGKDWMIQCWKGQYGWLLVGAEIGVYTAPEGSYAGVIGDVNHFDCAGQSDWLFMQLDCYWNSGNGQYKRVFTRPYGLYWWATGFVKGQLTKYSAPRTELKTKNRITFKDEIMASIFVEGLKKSGFRRAASADQLVDDSYFRNGKDVWFLWSTKNHECFVGYEGREFDN